MIKIHDTSTESEYKTMIQGHDTGSGYSIRIQDQDTGYRIRIQDQDTRP